MSRGSGLQTYEQHATEDQVISWTGDRVGKLQRWGGVLGWIRKKSERLEARLMQDPYPQASLGEEPEQFNTSTSLCAWRPGWRLALSTDSRLQMVSVLHGVILASACVPSCLMISSLDETSSTKYNANAVCVSFRLWFNGRQKSCVCSVQLCFPDFSIHGWLNLWLNHLWMKYSCSQPALCRSHG